MTREFIGGSDIQWILCWYENNGFVNWEVHPSRESALNEGPRTNEDWCVVRYNKNTTKYSIIGYSGRTFPVNILSSPYGYSTPLTIYSVPDYELSLPEDHYNGHHSHVTTGAHKYND